MIKLRILINISTRSEIKKFVPFLELGRIFENIYFGLVGTFAFLGRRIPLFQCVGIYLWRLPIALASDVHGAILSVRVLHNNLISERFVVANYIKSGCI